MTDNRTKKRQEASASERLRAGLDPDYREHADLFYMMHELSRLVSVHVDRAMAQHRLTHAQWWALMHVFEREGLTQSELAEVMQMGRAATGKLLERLEAKHWITRRPDAKDSRVRRVYLGDDVVPVFSLLVVEMRKLFKAFLKDVGAAEEEELVAGLHRIRANAETIQRPLGRTDRKEKD